MTEVEAQANLDLTVKKKKKKTTKTEETEAPAEQPAEEGADLGLKEKKKKKKKTTEATEEQPQEEGAAQDANPELELKEKKKKKKKKTEDGTEEVAATTDATNEETADFMASLKDAKKKKKKKKDKEAEDAMAMALSGASFEDIQRMAEEQEEGQDNWIKSERDYKFTELLERVFEQIKAKNPDLWQGKKMYKLKPPQIAREGTKKTVFVNFQEICKSMHRPSDHFLQFLLTELGTTGSVDGNERLVIKGRFLPKSIETILRRYITEFVACHLCKSLDTLLTRDPNTRLFTLQCSACSASRTVSAISKGFMAQVGKRKKQ